jgi:HTH-type transcriptional regulator / antitoxin HigA
MNPILSHRPLFVKHFGQFDDFVNFDYSSPVEPRTPGQLIKALLDERGWTQRVLALVLGVDIAIVNRLIADKKSVEAPMALMLGEAFGVEPERFMDLQKAYDLAMARIAAQPNPRRETRARLFSDLPVAEMIKRGWLNEVDDIRNIDLVEAALAKFFGVATVDEIEILPHAAKKTAVAGPVTPAQLAWLYRVRQIAGGMLAARYSPASVHRAIERIRPLLSAAEEARKVPRILAESGIRFVIVESLNAAKIDGVCFWLNDFSPVIGMSVRYDRIDNFYFVLRHELEHVARRHGRDAAAVDAELEGSRAGSGADIPEEERIANEAAADFCVPSTKMDRFVRVKSPLFLERDILGFAKTMGVHPGLVAGQLQHKTGRYDRFRNHLVKVRSLVAPGSMVDGWGDVSPVGL